MDHEFTNHIVSLPYSPENIQENKSENRSSSEGKSESIINNVTSTDFSLITLIDINIYLNKNDNIFKKFVT